MSLRLSWSDYCEHHPTTILLPALTGGGNTQSVTRGLALHKELPRAVRGLWWIATVVPIAFALLGAFNSGIL